MVKSHHNVGGLPDDFDFELVEPVKYLFKDEVRVAGELLGLPHRMVWRQPFPGPGLGVRVVGELTRDTVRMVRESDAIFRDEIAQAGLSQQIWQYFTVCPGGRAVGVVDGARTYGHAIVLRAVNSVDAMTADVAELPYDLLKRITLRIITGGRGDPGDVRHDPQAARHHRVGVGSPVPSARRGRYRGWAACRAVSTFAFAPSSHCWQIAASFSPRSHSCIDSASGTPPDSSRVTTSCNCWRACS